MSYGEWCPTCGAEIVSVTRGIPSMGTCANGHRTDRRDVLRREPEKPEMVTRAEADAMVAAALREAADRVYDYGDAKIILALIPQPASAALDKLIAEAEARGMERAAVIADECKRQNGPLTSKGFSENYRRGLEAGAEAIASAIRAAKGEAK